LLTSGGYANVLYEAELTTLSRHPIPAGLTKAEAKIYAHLDPARIPQHVAIIMDGNGRWARKRHLPRIMGHRKGVDSVRSVTEAASNIGLPWLTLYAFSAENWKRPRTEVDFLMRLLATYLKADVATMNDHNVRLEYLGRTHELHESLQDVMQWAKEETAKNTGTVLSLALNYGSRLELVDAFRSIVDKAKNNGGLEHLNIDEALIQDHLYTSHQPDPDLLIRTSGEMRISNFLLWQIAYSEIFVTDVLWPDFRGEHLLDAIRNFQARERRYGGLGQNGQENPAKESSTKPSPAKNGHAMPEPVLVSK